MSLTPAEKAHVCGQLIGRTCRKCGSTALKACDHGLSDDDGWGVRGAYAVCDDCGSEVVPPIAQVLNYWCYC